MTKQLLVTDKSQISVIEDEIVFIKYFKNSTIEKEDFEAAMEIWDDSGSSETIKLLIQVEERVTFTDEAVKFAQENKRGLKAEAHVLPNLNNRIMFILFTQLRKKSHPIRAFVDYNKAVKWLKSK